MDVRPFGHTRSTIKPLHALITPDTHVIGALPGWENTEGAIHISPQMGAAFTQYSAILTEESKTGSPPPTVQRFIHVLEGGIKATVDGQGEHNVAAGDYIWLPPDVPHTITSVGEGRLLIFEKPYVSLEGVATPEVYKGTVADVPGEPFLGDPDAILQTLLPTDPAWDMAINNFSYQPGAHLPQVEIHVMEHGLLFTHGAGVYRMEDSWYPVEKGDMIWMGPYCPQWFVAMGKEPAVYMYYKEMNRHPFEMA